MTAEVTAEPEHTTRIEWRIAYPNETEDFVCRTCGEPAYVNDRNIHEWACINCKYASFSISVYFRPLSESKVTP